MHRIESCCYRISAKALIFNEKWQILLCKETNGVWDIPWWWLDHWEDVYACIHRELYEEMWLTVTNIEKNPLYFIVAHKPNSKSRPWIANICYKTEVKNLEFKKSDECSEILFASVDDILKMNTIENVQVLAREILKNR